MLCTSTILENIKIDESIEYKKLCRLLKISKKADKQKLDIALIALEKLKIISKNDKNEFKNIQDDFHITAKIRCSSKGYCFAVREDSTEDIYVKENLLNYAWNGDKVLVRVIKEGVRRRSPEGVVDCILDHANKILLAKVKLIGDQLYAIPIDDRILAKIKLPLSDKRYLYDPNVKNIVKICIDMFPIGQQEVFGHVINELNLETNEIMDDEFVLSKNNIDQNIKNKINKTLEPDNSKRIDLTNKNSFMFKSWNYKSSPPLPIFQIETLNNGDNKLWIHTNSIAERIDFNDKNLLECFKSNFETYATSEKWINFLDEKLTEKSEFKIGQDNQAISICMTISQEAEVIDWSFYLTKVKCVSIIENKHLDALLTRKSKTRITSRILKPIKDYIDELDKIIELSEKLRQKQILNGKLEIPRENNHIPIIDELLTHKPADYTNDYLEPLSKNDIQTYISPLLFEADASWYEHAKNHKIALAAYHSQNINLINVNEIIKQAQVLDENLELEEDGSLTLQKLFNTYIDENKKRIINKYLSNILQNNKATLKNNNKNDDIKTSGISNSPWTLPNHDYLNLINQYSIYNMLINGKRSSKGSDEIDIAKMNSWESIDWKLLSIGNLKISKLLFSKLMIDKFNENKCKNKSFKMNMVDIKRIREAGKHLNKQYKGLITSVQSYGFFVEIPELLVEGLVHVSTLNDDWYEYRSRQNLLVGRKSKNTYRVGDLIDIKILKVDILKYQIDLELI